MAKKEQNQENEPVTKEELQSYLAQAQELESNRHKSEAVRYMFEPMGAIKRRMSRLNLKEIVTFANWSTLMALLNPDEIRLAPEIWMDFILDYKISEGGKGRLEGQNVFEMMQENKEMDEAFKG